MLHRTVGRRADGIRVFSSRIRRAVLRRGRRPRESVLGVPDLGLLRLQGPSDDDLRARRAEVRDAFQLNAHVPGSRCPAGSPIARPSQIDLTFCMA